MSDAIDERLDKLFQVTDTYEPYTVAKRMDIGILHLPLDPDSYGLTVRSKRNATIILNSEINENLREFVLGHELGHVCLHQNLSTPFMRTVGAPSQILRIEAEANTFSFKLLLRNHEELRNLSKEDIITYYQLPDWMERYI